MNSFEKARLNSGRLLAALALLAGLFWSVPAAAETEDVYTVRDVPVDATAEEAAEARVIAIRQGRALALRFLLQRLTLQADWPTLPTLNTSEITALGAGFEISNERNSPTRYLATITYRFKPSDIRGVLQQFDIPFSEVTARPMVVLPVFLKGENAYIFQEDRNWSLAWSDRNFAHELVPVHAPLGDLGDVIATPIEAVLDHDFAALSGFAERYGVQDILIAKVRHDDDTRPVVFEFVRLSPTETEVWTMALPGAPLPEEADEADSEGASVGPMEMSVPPNLLAPGEVSRGGTSLEPIAVDGLKVDGEVMEPEEPEFDLAEVMEIAIDKGIARLQEDWKERTIIRFDAQDTMIVSARFDEIAQWLVIKRAMQATPNITEHRLVALSTGGAHMEWDVVGTPEQLALALAQHDVALEAGTDAELAATEEISDGAFVRGMGDETGERSDPFNESGLPWNDQSSGLDDPSNPWGDDSNPWADQSDVIEEETAVLELDEEAGLQDRVEDMSLDFDDETMSEELAEFYRNLPPLGQEEGRFFVQSEDAGSIKFDGPKPEFWIVRFAQQVEPEVWPTQEEGAEDVGDVEPAEEDPEASEPFGGEDQFPQDGTF